MMIENVFSTRVTSLKSNLFPGLLLFSFFLELQPAPAASQEDQAAIKSTEIQVQFEKQIKPVIKSLCISCHNAEDAESGVSLEHLDGTLADRHVFLWEEIREQIADRAMPPEDEKQPTSEQRKLLVGWIEKAIVAAKSKPQTKNGAVRRLTVSQYRNTLNSLLGLKEDVTGLLPPDAISKDGFLNEQMSMQLSPLLVETYFEIAEKALDRCIVNEKSKPTIQTLRMELGKSINPEPCSDRLILGANSRLLANEDFIVTEPVPRKPFEFTHRRIQTKHRFIEGYRGNATVRGWREFDSIYHSVFACVRGTPGYPVGLPNESAPDGLLLRPAIPNPGLFGVSGTYGPNANFKISLRELPSNGNFRVKVTAAKYNDGLLLDRHAKPQPEMSATAFALPDGKSTRARIQKSGLYQVDIYASAKDSKKKDLDKKANPKGLFVTLQLGGRVFSGKLNQPAFLVVRLKSGELPITVEASPSARADKVVITPLKNRSDKNGDDSKKRFLQMESRSPRLGVHVGFRRDCGSTLAPVGLLKSVLHNELREFVFEDAINNFPSPDVEKNNVNYLAGIREIAVRSEYTDGRDMPRLLVKSVEFEGPYYECWPPKSHTNIFIESKNQKDRSTYAREIIKSFASRAFRRPVTTRELNSLHLIWSGSFKSSNDFHGSIKDALLVVLTSPQFLFQIENSESSKPEPLDSFELASKLSYFLWNSSPDDRLMKLASSSKLRSQIDSETNRMINDPKFRDFADSFASQWLDLDKLGVVETDRSRFSRLTREVKNSLRQEPVELVQHLIRNNMPLKNLVQSDFILANEIVASYYGLGDKTESGFEFIPIRHGSDRLGGVLTHAGILASLSDGRESNPIKRGAWLARKIVAEPPDDPPPNVPQLPEDDGTKRTLRERLELHRNQKGCVKCHEGIDPWGLPLEEFDAGGLLKASKVASSSLLPDQTNVNNTNELKAYLAEKRIDQVAFSFLKHLATYASGRTLSYNEIEFLKREGLKFKKDNYPMKELVQFVIKSPIFMDK